MAGLHQPRVGRIQVRAVSGEVTLIDRSWNSLSSADLGASSK